MTRSAPGNVPPELVELLDLVERLSRLAPRCVESLSAAQLERDKLLCELTQQAATFRGVSPRPFPHVGALVRWLREAAGLTRAQLAAQTGFCSSTIRNLEKDWHQPTAATLGKLLQHPAMRALPLLAQEAGLSPLLSSSQKPERIRRSHPDE
jgi:hypothetical protein